MDPRDNCLKRQLLFASVRAYHPTEAPPREGSAAPWLEDPVAIGGRPARTPFLGTAGAEIDLALVGRFEEGIVIAFRGTLPPLDLGPDNRTIVRADIRGLAVLLDWDNNFRARLRPDVAIGGATIPGAIHAGFAESLASLWPGIAAKVNELRGANDAPRLYFTGHSKGGALANLAAICARLIWPRAVVRVATFGAPRAGDAEFARAHRDPALSGHRYEVPQDVVPMVPPAGLVEGHLLPTLHECRPVGAPHPVALVSHPGIPDLIAAHLPYRGFGYGDNVCEAGCAHDWH